MSQLATLKTLEPYLSHLPQRTARRSSLEAYFSEINHGSFANSAAPHHLSTNLPQAANGATAEYRLEIK